YYNSTTSDMQNVQNQMTMIIQDIQRKVNEIYVDRKAAGFGNGQVESNTKWINAQRISRQAQSNIVQRIKDTIHNEFTDLSKPENRVRITLLKIILPTTHGAPFSILLVVWRLNVTFEFVAP
ncbi:3508_t:CDS:2, partial [Entrophospora sp. SA101]